MDYMSINPTLSDVKKVNPELAACRYEMGQSFTDYFDDVATNSGDWDTYIYDGDCKIIDIERKTIDGIAVFIVVCIKNGIRTLLEHKSPVVYATTDGLGGEIWYITQDFQVRQTIVIYSACDGKLSYVVTESLINKDGELVCHHDEVPAYTCTSEFCGLVQYRWYSNGSAMTGCDKPSMVLDFRSGRTYYWLKSGYTFDCSNEYFASMLDRTANVQVDGSMETIHHTIAGIETIKYPATQLRKVYIRNTLFQPF